MQESLIDAEGGAGSEMIVARLTCVVKLIMVVFIFIPRMVITVFLVWLGCRWLLATNEFGDLILNAVALGFVLELKDILYVSLVPARNKQDLANTKIRNPLKKSPTSLWTFANTFLWGVLSIVWVYLYIFYLQAVLPGYKWDVRKVCTQWIKVRYAV